MVENGWSPSVRLFEAAACGVPILTDHWMGLEDFFTPGKEILVARTTAAALEYVRDSESGYLQQIAARARSRVLSHHTAAHRACELERYECEVTGAQTQQIETRGGEFAATAHAGWGA
jgi:spore maturation protein CgeB